MNILNDSALSFYSLSRYYSKRYCHGHLFILFILLKEQNVHLTYFGSV